jgi:hypothetical protein
MLINNEIDQETKLSGDNDELVCQGLERSVGELNESTGNMLIEIHVHCRHLGLQLTSVLFDYVGQRKGTR